MFVVYKHTAPSGKVYIGITSQKPENRWGGGSNYVRSEYFYKAIQKYGWKNISHEILFEGLTKEEAEQKEIALIREYDSTNPQKGYNLRNGGSVCSFPPQTIEKLRLSHRGIPNTLEQRKKISNSLKGRKISKGTLGFKYSEESRRKMSIAQTGKFRSAETKAKISKNRAGKMTGAKNHKSKAVINIDTGKIYESQCIAAKEIRGQQCYISRCCLGLQKAYRGERWQFYEDWRAQKCLI
ncbi:MAG: hypothetical protein IIX93_05845 [Clostridia bacterium]|nr:hypothetical protein [Clostridia bacterium]